MRTLRRFFEREIGRRFNGNARILYWT
jgi:hypothetical protein